MFIHSNVSLCVRGFFFNSRIQTNMLTHHRLVRAVVVWPHLIYDVMSVSAILISSSNASSEVILAFACTLRDKLLHSSWRSQCQAAWSADIPTVILSGCHDWLVKYAWHWKSIRQRDPCRVHRIAGILEIFRNNNLKEQMAGFFPHSTPTILHSQ